MSADTGFTETQAEVGVASPAGASHGEGQGTSGLIDVTGSMMVLTWVAFALLSLVLYKVAWKPILKALDMRERSIRKALEEAEKARTETAATEARAAAQDGARTLQAQAEQQARLLQEEARRDIQAAVEQARATLRQETIDLAIAMAGKVVAANMDTDRNRAMVETLAGEL